MSTFAELKAVVQGNLSRVGAPSAEADTVGRWINTVIREDICAQHNWVPMYKRLVMNTTANVPLYPFPNPDVFKDCRVLQVRRTLSDRYSTIRELSEEQIAERYSDATGNTGCPKNWSFVADSFRLAPIPDVSTYSIRVWIWQYLGDLVQDSDTNAFTTKYSRLTELKATELGCLYFGMQDRAQYFTQLAERALAIAFEADRRRQLPEHLNLEQTERVYRRFRRGHGQYLPGTDSNYDWIP